MSIASHSKEIISALALLIIGGSGGFALARATQHVSCEMNTQLAQSPSTVNWRNHPPSQLLQSKTPKQVAAVAPMTVSAGPAPATPTATIPAQTGPQMGLVFVRNGAATTDLRMRFAILANGGVVEERIETVRAGQETYVDLPPGDVMAIAEPLNVYGWSASRSRAAAQARLRLVPNRMASLTFDDQIGLQAESN